MSLLIILGIIFAAVTIANFVLYIIVLIKLFKNEGVLLGIIGLFISIYTFIWGWIKHKQLEITKIMIWWSVLTVAPIVGGVVVSIAVPMAMIPFAKDQAAITMQKQMPGAAVKKGVSVKAKKPKAKKPVKEFEIVRYGIYHIELAGETIKNTVAKTGERKVVKNYKLLQQTEKIPAEIGTFFGFEYKLNGKNPGKKVLLTLHNNFPGLKDPAKEKVLKASETIEEATIGETQLVAYDFRKEWELVPGKWTFQLLRNGKLLGEKTFIVERM